MNNDWNVMAQNEFRQDLRATAERERAEAENRLQTISTKNESVYNDILCIMIDDNVLLHKTNTLFSILYE